MNWLKDIEETQSVKMNFPIIADEDKSIAIAYDMLHPETDAKFTVRSVFIIDPNKKVRLTLTYPPSTGRNFQEILRVLDSLQLTDGYSVATPVDWEDGEDVIVSPSIATEDITDKFPKGHKVIKSYLRTTPQPNR
jgi:alkyl hydroperoxide reductase subunit AhpC